MDAARRTVTYRAAVWCGRLLFGWLLVWFTMPFLRPPGLVVLSLWLAGVATGISTLVLLRLSGVRLALRFTSWYIADRETRRQFNRDLLWRQPR